MGPGLIRTLLLLLGVVLATVGALAPYDAPPNLGPGLLLGACIPLALWLVDWRLGGWLSRHRGDPVGPADFVREESLHILRDLGALGSLAAMAGAAKLHVLGEDNLWPSPLAAGCAALAALAWITRFIVGRPRRVDALADLYDVTKARTLEDQIAEAREFGRAVGPRLAGSFAAVCLLGLAMAILMVALGGGVLLLGVKLAGDGDPGTNLVVQLGALIALSGIGVSFAATSLTLFRLVAIARKTGRPPTTGALRQFGRAFETVGLLNTIPWSIAMAMITGLLGFSAWVVASLISSDPPVVAALTITLSGLLLWLLVALPQMFVFAVFTVRDCGWMGALESSTALLGFEGPGGLHRALLATLWSLTLVRAPAAIHLTLQVLDGREELLAALLREKPLSMAFGKVLEGLSNEPEALKRPFAAMEAGRYLEALNAFQIYLRKNRHDLHAIRGECLALLRVGNYRSAREKIEAWANLEPASDEPPRLLREIAEGRWSEGGDLRRHADSRRTEAAPKPPPSVRDFAPPGA